MANLNAIIKKIATRAGEERANREDRDNTVLFKGAREDDNHVYICQPCDFSRKAGVWKQMDYQIIRTASQLDLLNCLVDM